MAVLAVSLAVLSGCGGGGGDGDAPPVDGQGFVTAETHRLPVTVAAGGEVEDAVSGARFLFPEGASGTLQLTRLSGTPPPPLSQGVGWRIA